MEQQKEFVLLPVLYKNWSRVKNDLQGLADKTATPGGLHALEKLLEANEGGEVSLSLLNKVLTQDQIAEHFSDVRLPWLATKALQVEELFKDSGHRIKNLHTGCEGEVVLTRQQICCLMSLAFFNCFERQAGGYQEFTFMNYFSFAMYASQASKLRCLLGYFERLREAEEAREADFLSMCVTVSRRKLGREEVEGVAWRECSKPLVPLQSLTEGLIEEAHGCLQVDFANSYIGGGVLGFGNVQEEIRFVINPECLVSILFCEEMDELESILITGAEQFSSYTGYGGKFKYAGPYSDKNPVDDCRRRCVSIVAIDATPFGYSDSMQFTRENISRELNKAYSGFSCQLGRDDPEQRAHVATGNWGCGAFGGDKYLKTIIQWLAASRAGREVRYFTFTKDQEFSERQLQLVGKLQDKNVTVGKLYSLLVSGVSRESDLFEQISDSV